jgi:hypothetical protein
VAAGWLYSLGLKADGSIVAWGSGPGSPPAPNTGFVAVAAGTRHSLGLKAPLPGDLNCDRYVDFDDINPFVTALVGRGGYEAQYPYCNWLNADIDGNGSVDFDDINPFVACLVAGACP